MAFRVQARTILQLGAELISSDGVAFYELIKNAFDAGSTTVRIRIVSGLPHNVCNEYLDRLDRDIEEGKTSKASVKELQQQIVPHWNNSDKLTRENLIEFEEAATVQQLRECLKKANRIEVEDQGSGMSLDDLEEVYLTVGTRKRYEERKALLSASQRNGPVILGEKGIGRLSAMRLGRELSVRTSKSGERRWNVLEIDWDVFSHDVDQLLESVPIEPHFGESKTDAAASGTTITIMRLNSTWTRQAVDKIVADEFSKFIDPFASHNSYSIRVRFNGNAVPFADFDKALFEASNASLTAEYDTEGAEGPRLFGKIDYRRHSRSKTFDEQGAHLLTALKPLALRPSVRELRAVGPFELQLYWFNRKVIRETMGLEAPYILSLIRNWAGGVMVYRDGFRVNPYGGPEDDWLHLDRKALASGGYKLNRNQLVGKLEISARKNPAFRDQTNREGLRECDEKEALVALLRHVILTIFKSFLDSVERETKALEPISLELIEEKVDKTSKGLRLAWKALLRKYPEVNESHDLVSRVDEALDELAEMLEEVSTLVESYKEGRSQLVHLAGIGLMVEVVGHELNRATENTLRSLAESKKSHSTEEFETALESLHAQLKTLQKRLKILDPLSTAGRQIKEEFDLVSWIREIFSSHEAQFRRHNINPEFYVRGSHKTVRVYAVKGMIVQILENMIANSVYWLGAQQIIDSAFTAKLRITVDTDESQVLVRDNGPGVPPAKGEEIFLPFVTSKPPGEGKGLGLYVARELARYHGCSLSISEKKNSKGTLDTFVFDFSNIRR